MRVMAFIFLFIFSAQSAFCAPVSFAFGPTRLNKQVKSLKEMRMAYVVPQSWDYSCGPAALATILSYYFEDKVTEKQIISYLLLTTSLQKVKQKKGFSLLDLKRFAKARGYAVTGYNMDLEFMVKLNKPVLVPIDIKDYHHFVVFRGLKRGRVFLADPVLGYVTMRADRFLKIWKGGIGLVLEKNNRRLSSRPPLSLAKEDEILLSDSFVQHVLSQTILRNAFDDSEF